MKSTDVRIGNLLQRPSVAIVVVSKIETKGFEYCDDYIDNGVGGWHSNTDGGYIKGIPLTEEWLEKFGFEEYINFYNGWSCNKFLCVLSGMNHPSVDGCTIYGFNEESICNLKYVHQLQNLYFALTGEELTIKEPTPIDNN